MIAVTDPPDLPLLFRGRAIGRPILDNAEGDGHRKIGSRQARIG